MSRMKIPSRNSYRRRMGAFGAIDIKHDGSLLDFGTAVECYNVDMSSGALTEGYGIAADDYVPSTATGCWSCSRYVESSGVYSEQRLYQLNTGLLRYFDQASGRMSYISGVAYPKVTALNYKLNSREVILLSCSGHKLMCWNGAKLTEYADSPEIVSMALHYERLFAISKDEPTRVYFSTALDPTNWTIGKDGAGFIEFVDERGKLIKVVSFLNYLYIFREHGISRVTAYGDQSEFSVTNLFVSAGYIYAESIAVCGSVIMFAASDGIYRFDGYGVTRALENLKGLIAEPPRASAFFKGRYYLSCALGFTDGLTVGCEAEEHASNGLIVYDVTSGEYSISRGMDISFMNACTFAGREYLAGVDGKTAGVIEKCGTRFGVPLHKRWQGAMTDFGTPDRMKTVRAVYSDGDAFTLTLSTEKKKKTYKVSGGRRRVRVSLNGNYLSAAVETDDGAVTVRPLTVVYSTN